MLNLKKVIASICVIALMLSTVAFAANYSDVAENSAYYEAVETLSKLGIVTGYEDGSYKPETVVTRAEMAALIARIQGYDEVAKASAATIFADVAKEHWASGYVAQAANQGIINGYGDGTFGPDDAVTYEQAVKMIMATLGYTPYANFNGGYPTGYLAAATRYGVTKKVSNAVVGTGANRGTIAQLLNNAIDTPLMVQDSWSTNGDVEFIVYDGSAKAGNVYKTLMSEYLDVVKLKGVVTENSLVKIAANNKTIDTEKAAEIKFDIKDNFKTSNKYFENKTDDSFLVGESDAEDFIGKAVVIYVAENDDDKYEVVSITEDSAKNEVLTIALDQFGKLEGTKFYYAEEAGDDDYEDVTLAGTVKVVYNGVGGYAADAIFGDKIANGGATKANGGSIALIDNTGDGVFDVIFVEKAATAVVDKVSDGIVEFKADALWDDEALADIDFENEATDTVIVLTKDGEVIDYTELKEWDVLSIIAATDDAEGYVRAEVASNAIEGKISAKTKSASSYTTYAYTIDGKKYDAINGYKVSGLDAGAAGTFYIDKYGKIAAFNEDSAAAGAAGSYAYIMTVAAEKSATDSKAKITFQLLTADGIKKLNPASVVTVKDATSGTVKSADYTGKTFGEDGYDVDDVADFYNVAIEDVVKYTVNSKGEINTIVTADYNEKFAIDSKSGFGEYDEEDSRFIGLREIAEDAVIFFIDDEDSVIGTVADLADKNTYDVKAIYGNEDEEYNVFVIAGGLDAINEGAPAAIVTGISEGYDEEGASIFTLSYVQGNEAFEATSVADLALDGDISLGDIVKVKLNAAGNISALKLVLDLSDARTKDNAGIGVYYEKEYPAANEKLYGGPVAWANANGRVAFNLNGIEFLTDEDLETKTEGTDYVKFNLNKADTISVVEFKGNDGSVVDVRRGSASSFKFFEKLYDGSATELTRKDNVAIAEGFDIEDLADVEAYTDHVFVRVYGDDDLVEVVIIKAPVEIRVK